MNETIETYVTEETYSAYEIAKVLNKILSESGTDKTIRPQMMYNYARNGLIVKSEKIFGETLRRFTRDEVVTFVSRYIERNNIKIVKKENDDQLKLF